MDTPIAPNQDMVDFVSRDDAMRHAYLSEWMAQMDQVGYVDDAKRDIARNALIEGATLEFVIKITGLPLETVEKIAHQIKQENGNPWIPQ